MPTNIKIIEVQDFIRLDPDGTLDLRASRELLTELSAVIDTNDRYHVLIDTRGASVTLSAGEIFEIATSIASNRALLRQKVCLLVSEADSDNAVFLELVGRNRGANLRAFTDFETAIKWLIMREKPSQL